MKLVTELFQEVVEIKDDEITMLVIENQKVFYSLINDIYKQSVGEEGNVIISKDNKILKASKTVELVLSFFPFEINNRKTTAKLNSLLEEEALNEINYNRTMMLLNEIENYMDILRDSFNYNMIYNGISVSGLIKMCNVQIEDDSLNNIERVVNYMGVVTELLGEKLFIFVNMTSFFDEEDMLMFSDTVVKHKYQVLLLESREIKKLNGIRKLVVDRDLCII